MFDQFKVGVSTIAISLALSGCKSLFHPSVVGEPVSLVPRAAFDDGGSSDLVVVFAAGNEFQDVDNPADIAASLPTITVSATNQWDEFETRTAQDGEFDWGRNFGPEINVVAPGVGIITTDIAGRQGYTPEDYVYNGTSSATPHVAGVAALILSLRPGLSPTQVRNIIQDSALDLGDPGHDPYYGHGRLDAEAALALTLQRHPSA